MKKKIFMAGVNIWEERISVLSFPDFIVQLTESKADLGKMLIIMR